MKTTKWLFLLALLFTFRAEAQIDSTQYELDYIFSGLDKSKMSTNMLIDKTLQRSNLENFSDTAASTASIADWDNVYMTLYYSLWNPSFWPEFSEMNDRFVAEETASISPVGLIAVRYNALKDSAFEKGLIDTLNERFIDGPNASAGIYDEKLLFMATCARPNTDELNPIYKFTHNLFFSNIPSGDIHDIEVDFGDGWGWRKITFGDTIHVHYGTVGMRNIQCRATISGNGSLLTIKSSIRSEGSVFRNPGSGGLNKMAMQLPDDIKWFPNNASTLNELKAIVGVKYGYDIATGQYRTTIKRPFLIVEGIDFPNPKTHAPDAFGTIGSNGLATFLNGLRKNDKGSYEPWSVVKDAPDLFDKIRNKGYDIVFIDFYHNTQPMAQNGELVIQILQDLKAKYGLNDGIVMCGASMGGQICRYALSKMEKMGIDHCVKLYISFDSPNQGANIPIGLQSFISHHQFTLAQLAHAQKNLNSPAARELLIHHFSNMNYGSTAERKNWLNTLKDAGSYPIKCRKVAIANGSLTLLSQGFGPGDMLASLNITDPSAKYTFPINLFNKIRMNGFGAIVNNIYTSPGKNIGATPRIINAFISNGTVYPKYWAPQGFPQIDDAPGGSYNISNLEMALPMIGGFNIVHDRFCFIPTASALDITIPNHSNQELIYKVAAKLYWSDKNTRSTVSPFDAYFGQEESNQAHVQITQNGITWLISQLDLLETGHPQLFPTLGPSIYTTYNYAEPGDNILYPCLVTSGGKIQINGGYKAGYAGKTYVPANYSTHTVSTNTCQVATINIERNGILELGDGNAKTIGNVILKAGSKITIRTGGILFIRNQSKLILEEGAVLEIEDGAHIELTDYSSVIEFKKGSKLLLANNANFRLKGNGHLIFREGNGSPNIIGNNASFFLEGNDRFHKRLEIEGLNALVFDQQMNVASIHNCFINMKWLGEIKIHCTADLDHLEVTSDAISQSDPSRFAHKGIYIFKDAKTINDLHVVLGSPGLSFPGSHAPEGISVSNSRFEYNNLAIRLNGNGIKITDCHFKFNNTPIEGSALAGLVLLSWSQFYKNERAIQLFSTGGAECYLIGNTISQTNDYGVEMLDGTLYMKCNTIKNCKKAGLKLEAHTYLYAGEAFRQGYNVFLHNSSIHMGGDGSSIFANRAGNIDIKNGRNSFQYYPHFPIQGRLAAHYFRHNNISTLDINNNYWGEPYSTHISPFFNPFGFDPCPDNFLFSPFLRLDNAFTNSSGQRIAEITMQSNGTCLPNSPNGWIATAPGQEPYCSRVANGDGFIWTIMAAPEFSVSQPPSGGGTTLPPVTGEPIGGGQSGDPGTLSPIFLQWDFGYSQFMNGYIIDATNVFGNLLLDPALSGSFLLSDNGKALYHNFQTCLKRSIADSLLLPGSPDYYNQLNIYNQLIMRLQSAGAPPEQLAQYHWNKSVFCYQLKDLLNAVMATQQAEIMANDLQKTHIATWGRFLDDVAQYNNAFTADTLTVADYRYPVTNPEKTPVVASPQNLCLQMGQSATVTSNFAYNNRWFVMPASDTIDLSLPLPTYAETDQISVSNVFPSTGTIFLLYGIDENGFPSIDLVNVQDCSGNSGPLQPVILGKELFNPDAAAPFAYPNPFNDIINISMPGTWKSAKMTLTDAYGRIILSQQLKGTHSSLALETLPAGTYQLTLINELGEMKNIPVIRQ